MSLHTRADTGGGVFDLAPSSAVRVVLSDLVAEQLLSAQGLARIEELLVRFAGHLERGHGLASLSAVRASHAASFVEAPSANGQAPAVATMHLRRSALRLFFRSARRLGLFISDPTLDLDLPPRSSLAARPLSDVELACSRSASLGTLSETRLPAAWALAEATARTSEIPAVRVSDLEMDAGRVWLHGSSKVEPRWARLTDWGAAQLSRRFDALRRSPDPDPLLCSSGRGTEASRQASSCVAIGQVLRRAGLGQESDVRPASVAAWAGARALAEGAPIDEVARMLGVRSLDRAARLIGWDWTEGGND